MMFQQPVTNGIRDTSEAIYYSLYNALNRFISFLPALIGAILIVVIGWFISGLIANLIERGLKAVGLESAVERSGIGDFIRRSGTAMTTSGIIAALIKYSIFLIFVQAAANVLGIPQLTEIINSIILYIPNVIVAIAIIVIGTFIAQFLAGLVRSSVSELGVGNPNLLAKLTQYVVVGFAVIAAINQLGIAETVVSTLLFGLIGSVALAFGLAFGLGGRETAAQITQKWYESSQSMADAARAKAGIPSGGNAKVYRVEPTTETKQVG
ncbi:MAG: small-conductance mechanosensitive ion channel [Acidobacteriota bacterium]|nr:small-conductance mechanosensitive ion channel [Acidobacteriota bacterium]